jgi:hypothetical protein
VRFDVMGLSDFPGVPDDRQRSQYPRKRPPLRHRSWWPRGLGLASRANVVSTDIASQGVRRPLFFAFVDKALGRGQDRRRDRSHEHQGSEAADQRGANNDFILSSFGGAKSPGAPSRSTPKSELHNESHHPDPTRPVDCARARRTDVQNKAESCIFRASLCALLFDAFPHVVATSAA